MIDKDARQELVKEVIRTAATVAVTEVVQWVIGALKDRKRDKKDADGVVIIE